MKTAEELRKELERLKREEYDACLDFSHKIKPLEEQLRAVENGDLIFQDVQIQSKLAYVNDLLSNSGIPLLLTRKSNLVEFTPVESIDTFYRQLALFYRRKEDKRLSLFYTFDKVTTVGELFEQVSLVEQQLNFLGFLCSVNPIKYLPPYFEGTLGGEVSMFYYDLGGFRVIDTSLIVAYNKETDRYTIKLDNFVEWFCEEDTEVPSDKFKEVKTALRFRDVESLKLIVSKDNVRSSDLKSALEELKARLLELNEKGKDKVTVELTLVTE